MGRRHYDEETNIETRYYFYVEGIRHLYLNPSVTRHRSYWPSFDVDVRLCVEFANSEDCTRFIHEDMRKLEGRRININDCGSDVGVIDDIIRALSPLDDDHRSARRNAARRGIPFSQFDDEYPQPETQVIRRRAGVTLAGRTMSIISAHRALLGLVRLV
ncbi:hypothetical protein AB1N83_011321 [Pleurotus pulmonarius]